MSKRRRRGLLSAGLTLLLVLAILSVAQVRLQAEDSTVAALNLGVEIFVPAGHLARPVDIVHAGDSRLFVVEKGGRIRTVDQYGAVVPVPFLDIRDRVLSTGFEQGLLGLAFHPNFEENGYFYVNYTAKPDGKTHVSRFWADSQADVADAGSEEFVLTVPQPYANHNAGDLVFGPDGYLYIPLGDGGSSYDPQNRAQNPEVLLGKILRIDVNGQAGVQADCGTPGNYTIPDDNPFVDGAGGTCDEIWALGLRNPWRVSFDLASGGLYIGDVGQHSWEEIDFQPGSSPGGENYGWRCYEGAHETPEQYRSSCHSASAYEMPIFEYAHNDTGYTAVTGGYVYRGRAFPEMVGHYFLADFDRGDLWDLDVNNKWAATRHDGLESALQGASTFGQDIYGELYVANLYNGALYRLTEDTPLTLTDGDIYLPLLSR